MDLCGGGMIQAKKKICSSCQQEKVLWKSTPKLCKDCYFRMPENKKPIEKKVYVIPKESTKRSKENRLYHAKEFCILQHIRNASRCFLDVCIWLLIFIIFILALIGIYILQMKRLGKQFAENVTGLYMMK